jgi:hypothetical protein
MKITPFLMCFVSFFHLLFLSCSNSQHAFEDKLGGYRGKTVDELLSDYSIAYKDVAALDEPPGK